MSTRSVYLFVSFSGWKFRNSMGGIRRSLCQQSEKQVSWSCLAGALLQEIKQMFRVPLYAFHFPTPHQRDLQKVCEDFERSWKSTDGSTSQIRKNTRRKKILCM